MRNTKKLVVSFQNMEYMKCDLESMAPPET